ncbi:hypothetical protein ABZ942_14180 [Nocardia sp. NPDC046473]|uniref:hypothetical protein n=1 Tax=Nocardia sp. NPDC046473 TaxID=3155733 RepID=UPI0033EEE714
MAASLVTDAALQTYEADSAERSYLIAGRCFDRRWAAAGESAGSFALDHVAAASTSLTSEGPVPHTNIRTWLPARSIRDRRWPAVDLANARFCRFRNVRMKVTSGLRPISRGLIGNEDQQCANRGRLHQQLSRGVGKNRARAHHRRDDACRGQGGHEQRDNSSTLRPSFPRTNGHAHFLPD